MRSVGITANRMVASQPVRQAAWPALMVLCAAQLVMVLNFQIVGIALPRIGAGLGFGPAGMQWVISINALAFGGFLLFGGRAGDLFGHRRLFMTGLGVYAFASLACGLAPSPLLLILARAGQGFGTALFVPATLALIAGAFPEGQARDRALAAWAASGPLGGILSVAIGGAVADALGWRAVFLISVPLAAIPLVLAPGLLAASPGREAGRMDIAGAVTGTAAIIALVYALDQAARNGLASLSTGAALAIGVALLAVFAGVERRTPSPLVPARLVRQASVGGGSLVAFLHGAATNTPLVFFALYLQRIEGASLLETGIAFLPCNLGVIAGAMLGARVATRFGIGTSMAAGMATVIAGLLLLGTVSIEAGYVTTLLPGLVGWGAGLGLAQVGIVGAVTAGAAPADRGIAAGLMNTSAQIGTAVGLAVLTVVVATRMPTGTDPAQALVSGIQWAFRAAAGLAALGMLVALTVRSLPAVPPAVSHQRSPDE